MDGLGQKPTIRPKDLPAPPQAAIQILRACAKDSISNTELSKLANNDPMMAAELLRIVNSPYFGFGKNIQSIPRAITLIGQKALRNLALCVSIRDAFPKKAKLKNFDPAAFWEDAIRRAACARALGKQLRLDADDCFTAGLLQDFGLLLLLFLNPQHAEQWQRLRCLHPTDRRKQEDQLFRSTHDQTGALLAQHWGLPKILSDSIANHHQPDTLPAGPTRQLAEVLSAADWLAAVFETQAKGDTLRQCRERLAATFKLTAEHVADILTSIPNNVREAAGALGLGISEQSDFEAIMQQANMQLADANMSFQELTWQLENALKERDRLQAQLQEELLLAGEIQRSLLPNEQAADFPVIGMNMPARQLSGDFYDYFKLPNGKVYFNLGDVSGKGVNAALLMAKTCSLFRCLGKQIHEPGELLGIINNELCETSIRGVFVTMVAGLYDTTTGEVQLVNAGHMPVILATALGKFAKIEAQGPPLGVIANLPMHVTKFNLTNSSLYLYSDGVTESRQEQDQELGLNGLLALIRRHAGLSPAQRLAAIMKQLTADNGPLRDDITLMLVEPRCG